MILHSFAQLLFLALALALPLFLLSWAILRWVNSSPRVVEPAWRSYIAFIATSLGAVSLLMWIILTFVAGAVGGFPYYDAMVLNFYRWGFLTGTAGFVISLAGKGKLRWPSCGLSILMALLWMMAATGE